MKSPLVTILIPNYKTETLTKLCLRLLRKYTDLNKAKVIVIDNDSQDASLEYLRSVKWIELIERKALPNEKPVQSHSRALDLGLERTKTPFVLSIHTDTLVQHPSWLDFLINQINKRPTIAGVGSWKLEQKHFLQKTLKQIERRFQLIYYTLTNRKKHALEGIGKNYYYLRSHCAMYRTDLLKSFKLQFGDDDMVAGKSIHHKLVAAGYEMIFIPSDVLIKYLDHINHATTLLNPELSRHGNIDKRLQRVQKRFVKMNADAILQEHHLDQ